MCVWGGGSTFKIMIKNDENENFGAAAHGDWCHTCKSDEKCTAGPVSNGRRPRAAGLLSLSWSSRGVDRAKLRASLKIHLL